MPKAPKISLSVGVVIEHPFGQSILLERRKSTGQWSIISGNVEPGEGFLNAAYREMKEELHGMSVAIRGLLRALVVFTDEKISFGVVFLGIYLPNIRNDRWMFEGVSVDDMVSWGKMNLLDDDADGLGFFSRAWIRGLINNPEDVYMPEKNIPTLALWASGYSLPQIPPEIWKESFLDPPIAAD